jgi:hypothetical protein
VNGTSGINGSNGTSGINGTNGTSGINGTNGTSGINGVNGTNGTNGTSGTSVTVSGTTNYVVKFSSASTIANSQIFDNGTNVGIGTTTPFEKVQIGNGSATSGQYLRIWNSNSDIYLGQSGGTIFGLATGTGYFILGDNASYPFAIGTSANQPFILGSANTERMRITNTGTGDSFLVEDSASTDSTPFVIDSSGNVGIGLTSVTQAKLQVRGSIRADAAASQDGIVLTGRAGGANSYASTLTPTTLTAQRTLTLPDKTGTVATTADLGLVFVSSGTFSGATTASISSVFSSTYDNYRLVLSNITTDSSLLYLICMNLRATSTDSTTGYYSVLSGMLWSGTTEAYGLENSTFGIIGTASNSGDSSVVMDICRPNIADNTNITVQNSSYFGTYTGAVRHSVATAYNGFTLSTFRLGASPANINATWKLYGYTN